MKKLSLLSLFVVLTLLLAACGGGAEGNQTTPEGGAASPGVIATSDQGGLAATPGTGGGALGTATPGISGGGTVQATDTRQPTATTSGGAGGTGGVGGTGTPSAGGITGGTGVVGTSTPGTGAGGTGGLATPGVPVTGQMMNVVRGSDLLDFRVEAAGGAGGMGGTSGGMQTVTPAAGGAGDAMATGTPGTGGTGGAMQTGTPSTGGDTDGTGGAQTGEEFGEVDDVILPVMGGAMGMDQTIWLVVAVDETFLDLGPNQLVPVPLRNAQVDEDRQVITLQIDPNMIERAPSFSSNQWPDMSTPGWDVEFNSFWENQAGGGTDGSGGDTGGLQTGTPAAGGALETGTPAAGGTGAAQQTGTPAAGGDTGMGASANFVRLSELLTFQVQSSQVDAGGTQQTGTPAAGGGTGGMQGTGTPAADDGDSAGGSGNSLGAVLGDVNDVIINLGTWDTTGTGDTSGDMTQGSSATVTYLVVSADENLGFSTDANLVAIPWRLVQSVNPDQQLILVDVDQDQFQGAPAFGEDSWPTMTGETWDQEWEQYWQSNTSQ